MARLIKRNVPSANAKRKSSKRDGKKKSSSKRKGPEITVDLPFPPNVKLEKFFPSKYTVSLRTLNAFIIYRKVVSAEIKKSHTLCWSKISTIASEKWNLEDDSVKQHYKELAEKAKALYRSKHLFYVHQGRNAASSVMLQDETTENTPKTFTFVPEYHSSNEVAEQQKSVSDELVDGGEEISETFDNVNILPNENVLSPTNTAFIDFINMIDFPISTFLQDDRSFPLEMVNDNMFDARGFYF